MEYKNIAAFINRQEEMQFLKQWMAQEPNHILFFYGPKSSGKTNLIYRFVEGLLRDDSRISVKLFNLREILIVNYDDFLQRFFSVEDSREETSSQTRPYDLKVFKLTVQTEQKLRDRRLDPFDVMKVELKELNVKGIRSVITIDELQALDSIYFNGQRELMGKESNIREYVLSDFQIEYIWEHFGGSIWEISMLIGHLLKVCQDGKVASHEMEKIVERYILQARSYFDEYVGLKEQRKLLLKTIHENMTKGFFKEAELAGLLEKGSYTEDAVRDELNYLVQQNYLYYNPTLVEYKLQGRSMKIGLDRYVREISGPEEGRT